MSEDQQAVAAAQDNEVAVLLLARAYRELHEEDGNDLPSDTREFFEGCVLDGVRTHADRAALRAITECLDRQVVGIASTPAEIDDFFASALCASAGFVLVPREPTEEMLDAGINSDLWGGSTLITRAVRGVWSAMLAASPDPVPASNQAGEVIDKATLAFILEDVANDTIAPSEGVKRILAALTTPPARSYADGVRDAADLALADSRMYADPEVAGSVYQLSAAIRLLPQGLL